MKNWHRWLATISLAFFGGVLQCLADSSSHQLTDYIRHGGIALLPTIAALKMTLEKEEGENK